MTPFFSPGPSEYGAPAVFVAAVGEKMTEVASEVADGMLVHGFTTERYLREVTLPTIDRGLAKSGRDRSQFQMSYPAFIVSGITEEQMQEAATGARRQIAFYASTPAYKGVLDLHGWGDLQPDLNRLSKQGEWAKMGELIDDEILGTFAVIGEPDSIPGQLKARFGDVIDRISFYMPYKTDTDQVRQLVEGLKAE
jgi:probable F420-dependent oxidoreductase